MNCALSNSNKWHCHTVLMTGWVFIIKAFDVQHDPVTGCSKCTHVIQNTVDYVN